MPTSLPTSSTPLPVNWNTLWQQYAITAEQNPAQTFRRTLIIDALQATGVEPTRLADFGSGQGDLALLLQQCYPRATIYGLDMSSTGVALAQKKVPRAQFFVANLLEASTIPAQLKDWPTHAVCAEVLEHIEHPRQFLKNIKAILPPDSWLVVTVPGGPRTYFDRHIGHYRHYTRSSLRALFEESGFVVRQIEACGWPFFNLYKALVALRGKAFLADIAEDAPPSRTGLRGLVGRLFDLLLRQQRGRGRFGWQLLAIAQPNSFPVASKSLEKGDRCL